MNPLKDFVFLTLCLCPAASGPGASSAPHAVSAVSAQDTPSPARIYLPSDWTREEAFALHVRGQELLTMAPSNPLEADRLFTRWVFYACFAEAAAKVDAGESVYLPAASVVEALHRAIKESPRDDDVFQIAGFQIPAPAFGVFLADLEAGVHAPNLETELAAFEDSMSAIASDRKLTDLVRRQATEYGKSARQARTLFGEKRTGEAQAILDDVWAKVIGERPRRGEAPVADAAPEAPSMAEPRTLEPPHGGDPASIERHMRDLEGKRPASTNAIDWWRHSLQLALLQIWKGRIENQRRVNETRADLEAQLERAERLRDREMIRVLEMQIAGLEQMGADPGETVLVRDWAEGKASNPLMAFLADLPGGQPLHDVDTRLAKLQSWAAEKANEDSFAEAEALALIEEAERIRNLLSPDRIDDAQAALDRMWAWVLDEELSPLSLAGYRGSVRDGQLLDARTVALAEDRDTTFQAGVLNGLGAVAYIRASAGGKSTVHAGRPGSVREIGEARVGIERPRGVKWTTLRGPSTRLHLGEDGSLTLLDGPHLAGVSTRSGFLSPSPDQIEIVRTLDDGRFVVRRKAARKTSIEIGSGSEWRTVLASGMHAPGFLPTCTIEDLVALCASHDGGTIFFTGTLKGPGIRPGDSAGRIWVHSPVGTTLFLSPGDSMPGGGSYDGIGARAAMNSRGDLALMAKCNGRPTLWYGSLDGLELASSSRGLGGHLALLQDGRAYLGGNAIWNPNTGEINEVEIPGMAGQIARLVAPWGTQLVAGMVREPSGGIATGLWAGDVEAPELLVRTGDRVALGNGDVRTVAEVQVQSLVANAASSACLPINRRGEVLVGLVFEAVPGVRGESRGLFLLRSGGTPRVRDEH